MCKEASSANLYPIKARYFVLLWFSPLVFLPGINLLDRWLNEYDVQWYWYDISYYLYFYSLMGLIAAILTLKTGSNVLEFFARPKRQCWPMALQLTFLSFLFSTVTFYLSFIPLSYVAPDLVQYWVIDLPPLIYYSESGHYPLVANALGLVCLIVLPPLFEELVFRGFLLRRWTEKYNRKKAIWLSSVLFGLMHTEPIGATIFGVAMCCIYFYSGSLWLPIACHALNNLVFWLWEWGYIAYSESESWYSLELLRSEWPWAVVSAVLLLVLSLSFNRRGPLFGALRLVF